MQSAARKTSAMGRPTSTPSLLLEACLLAAGDGFGEGEGEVISEIVGPPAIVGPSRSMAWRPRVRLLRDSP